MPREHEHSAYNFHSDLFLSGLERIIMVSRPSIRILFPQLHSARPYLSSFFVISFEADERAARTLHCYLFFLDWAKGVDFILSDFTS